MDPQGREGPETELDAAQLDALRLTITRLARSMRKHSGADLTPSQMSALTTLERHGTVRTGRLAELEGISKSSVTRLADRLEALGLLSRTVDDSDARSWQVALTDEGRRLLASSNATATDYLARKIAILPVEEQGLLGAALPALEMLLTIRV